MLSPRGWPQPQTAGQDAEELGTEAGGTGDVDEEVDGAVDSAQGQVQQMGSHERVLVFTCTVRGQIKEALYLYVCL